MSRIMKNSPQNAWRSGCWRLARRQLTRLIRLWERRPMGQRQREVLVAFVGLLLLGLWSVSVNVSSQPLTLLSTRQRQTTHLSASTQAKTLENLSTQRTTHGSNSSDSINLSNQHGNTNRPSVGRPSAGRP